MSASCAHGQKAYFNYIADQRFFCLRFLPETYRTCAPCSPARSLQLIVYGPGRVEPSTLRELRPGLLYSVAVAISPAAQYGRIILLMGRGFCTDAAGHPFTRTANSTFTLRFGTRRP